MSRTIRRGKPSRDYVKYISIGTICHQNKMFHGSRWLSRKPPVAYLYWKDDENDTTTYEQYAALRIRRYHMDFRPRSKCPGDWYREDTLRQKRQHKAALSKALQTGDFDVVLEPHVNEAQRMWEWW
ncbi:hypothetical protein D3C76_212410 [compost metagenome]